MSDTFNGFRAPGVANVVCKFRMGNAPKPDIMTLALSGQYAPKIFPASVCHLLEPNSTMVAFQSGTTIILGTKHPSDALVQVYKIIYYIFRKTGKICSVHDFRVENVVGSAWLGCRLDIGALARTHALSSRYESTVFPGLHFTLPQTNYPVKFIFFKLGRMVITGAKTGIEIQEAYNRIVPILRPFVHPNESTLGNDVRSAGSLTINQ
jgi:TATA-box binding protein (TBP) (component of TFIID and TFIIIB)